MDSPYQITKHYNDTVELIFTEKNHSYTADGEPVDGVTTPLSIISKKGLLYWAVDKTIEFLNKSWDITEDYDEISKSEVLDMARFAHRRSLKSAANIGTLTHGWIEGFIKNTLKGEKAPLLPKNEVAKRACKLFYNWYKKYKVKFLFSEKKVYSKKYKYAGTADLGCEINGRKLIGDVKTSTGIYPEMYLQTGAYQLALEEEFPGEKWDGNFIIRCGKDGTLEIGATINTEDNKRGFLASLALYQRIKKLEKERKEEEKENKGMENASFMTLIGMTQIAIEGTEVTN